MLLTADLRPRLRRIRLFLTDVDGVLTDASVLMGAGGTELKRFDIRDGLGLKLLQQEGIKVGFVSARPSAATTARAEDLGIDFLHQSPAPKVEAVEELLAKTGHDWTEVSFMGDDVLDLGVLKRAGFAAAPADAHESVRNAVQLVTQARGGYGAVREVVEHLLKAQGRWPALLAKFAS
jgi:3-deoxy-D-manno-octulosonate 8-phosphate phosphatase (KDO 8-P phosphatase)